MVASCCRENINNNIYEDHHYSFLGTVELSNKVKLARLRNPWAFGEYNGTWSEKDEQWTPELLKEVNHSHGVNDGIFFMPFDIFYKQFYELDVAYY